MKRLFLATSFSGKVDAKTGEVEPEFRKQIEEVLKALRAKGLEVFCAIEDEGWVIPNVPPEVGVSKDLKELESSDVLVALVDNTPSAGVQFEIGFSVGRGKKVFIITAPSEELAYFNQGVTKGGLVTHVSYQNSSDLADQLNARIEP